MGPVTSELSSLTGRVRSFFTSALPACVDKHSAAFNNAMYSVIQALCYSFPNRDIMHLLVLFNTNCTYFFVLSQLLLQPEIG